MLTPTAVRLASQSSNDSYAALLYQGSHPTEGVILTHGMFSSKQSRAVQDLLPVLCHAERTALAVDLYAHGESTGSFTSLTAEKIIESITTAIDYLRTQEVQSISLFGSSMSGFACLEAAHRYQKFIKNVVLKSPVVSYRDLYQRRLGEAGLQRWKADAYLTLSDAQHGVSQRLPYTFFESLESYPFATKPLSPDVPVHVVYGGADTVVPPEHIEQEIPLKASAYTLCLIPGADHAYSNANDRAALQEALSQRLSGDMTF
jgi:pimeloyl-ACP methyl ester carboxylesterase